MSAGSDTPPQTQLRDYEVRQSDPQAAAALSEPPSVVYGKVIQVGQAVKVERLADTFVATTLGQQGRRTVAVHCHDW